MHKFMDPASVALIGTPRRTGPGAFNNAEMMLRYGYRGRIYPVNPAGGDILGLKVYPALSEIPETDGEEAVAKFHEAAKGIQLLVLDIVMPKKNGKEVLDAIRLVQPGIKALFTSGYTAEILDRKGIQREGIEFLSKPVSPSEFLKKVRDVLDGK